MPIRNPFARRPPPLFQHDNESQRPGSAASSGAGADVAHPGFERVDTVGSKASPAFSIRSGGSRRSQDTGEYKMSVVNDSGVYLPPSPIEREATWPRRYLARTSSDRSSSSNGAGVSGSGAGEIEHFPISRESFDSYRRSFDITARSPIITSTTADAAAATAGRQSLDSMSHRRTGSRNQRNPPFLSSPTTTIRFPRSSLSSEQHHRWGREEEEEEPEEREGYEKDGGVEAGLFEDVRLADESAGSKPDHQGQGPQQQKKRGFFAKFGSDAAGANGHAAAGVEETAGGGGTATGGGGMLKFLPLGGAGRKRASSGGQQHGAELGAMPAVVGLGKMEREEGRLAQEVEA